MATVSEIAKKAERFMTVNSPTILTVIGVTGTITTAYLTGKASFKAAEVIRAEQFKLNLHETSHPLETREKVELVWKLYIPAVSTGVLTCSAIVCANRIGTRRTAAVAAAYSISEKAFAEYKEKVVEKLGEKKEQEVREEVAQDRVNRTAPQNVVIHTDTTKVMCHDMFSNQYFWSDMETLRRAENDINKQILHSDYATVSDYYQAVGADGLETTSVSGDMGWNTDKMLEVSYLTTMYQDRIPCISINFAAVPINDPWRFC